MKFENRKYIIILIFLTVGTVFICRLAYMQLMTDKWSIRAAEITQMTLPVYAPRGIIYDRNGIKLVDNQAYYDIHVIPNNVGEIDTIAFCDVVGITKEEFDVKLKKARTEPNVGYAPSEFMTQISADDFIVIKEQLYKYQPGFFEVENPLRNYPMAIAPHILGYINEVDKDDMSQDEYYRLGDNIGKSGIERAYEKELRGNRGMKYLLKNAKGLATRELDDPRSKEPENGKDLIATIDAYLQEYGEQLMSNKIGSIVAIEPSTGEILAMVSAPSYDPNWIVGKKNRNKHYPELQSDTLKPLINRTSYSTYPPGSIFKMFQAIVGMNLGRLTPQTTFVCDGSLIGDHAFGTFQMYDAIKMSSNQWFYLAMKRVVQQGKYSSHFKDSHFGLDIWASEMRKFGLGVPLPLEIGSGKIGRIPDSHFYDEVFPFETNGYGAYSWAYSTIASNSIGQGEVELTPLQMANLGCILANRGHYYYPHLVKKIGNEDKKAIYRKRIIASEDASQYQVVLDAMQAVIDEAGGTARRARTKDIVVCGKTGTAENPHGEDHSVFLAFAPKDNPKIAIAVYVENAKWGGEWAAPIASLMIEKYLTGAISNQKKEQRILDRDFISDPLVKTESH